MFSCFTPSHESFEEMRQNVRNGSPEAVAIALIVKLTFGFRANPQIRKGGHFANSLKSISMYASVSVGLFLCNIGLNRLPDFACHLKDLAGHVL